MSLRKSVQSREFQGRQYQVEERQIGRGDSLWRILVEEKGVAGQKFRSYIILIRGLNPQVSNLDVLRIGDKIFVPLQLDETPDARRADQPTKPGESIRLGTVTHYRVKPGEHLYQILREQLRLTDERKLAQYYALVRDLNPERKNWDTLLGGEVIRLPAEGPAQTQVTQTGTKTAPRLGSEPFAAQPSPKADEKQNSPVNEIRHSLVAPVKENLPLFSRVAEALGVEMHQSGDEVVNLADGTVRFARSSYPVAYNSGSNQRVVIDPESKIAPSLAVKLNEPTVGTPVVSFGDGTTMRDAVAQLLARLGYQALPADQSIVIQEEGVTFEAKGDWVVLAPEVNNKTQEMYVINLTEKWNETPAYLRSELAKKGLHLREVALRAESVIDGKTAEDSQSAIAGGQTKRLPRDKQELVDTLLLLYGVTFGVAEKLPLELADGVQIDVRVDRLFEFRGQRTALFFSGRAMEFATLLAEKQGITPVMLDLSSMSTREIITGMLNVLGDPTAYREHRFVPAADATRAQIAIRAWGFQPTKKTIFITDRQIPATLQRFFFEKGLDIVYFQ
ncbi:MAG TPA: hypothetical protein VF452_12855 [Candidatus Binatia bacterium]